ncbi:MAG: DUF6850 family outer membrane beta-barrel protein [Gemmatimonadota bacterium]
MGDLPRSLPGGEAVFPSLLILPAPRIGLFWTAGNPGALAQELEDRRTEFHFELDGASGDFRRPLDTGEERHARASGLAWGSLGDHGAAIGRIGVDRTDVNEAAFSDVLVPYTSSPFTVIDTIGDPTNRTAVRLEGAGSWSFGPLGAGLTLGFEAQDTRTQESPVPRTVRTASPGVVGGLSYELAGRGLRLGVFGRWRRSAHMIDIFSVGAPSRVYALEGYNEPVAINLSSTLFTRRFERTTWAAGGGLAGEAGHLSWVAFAQREDLGESRFNPNANDPLTDQWDTKGWTVGGAVQMLLSTERLLVTVDARFTALDGEAREGGLEGITFRADEHRLDASGEIRLLPGASWEAALRPSLVRTVRTRVDELARADSRIESWTPSGALEVARHLGRVAIGLGGAASRYTPTATTPDPATIGPIYARWIAPGLAVRAADAVAWSGTASARLQTDGPAFWLRGQFGSVSAVGNPVDVPRGNRDGWTLTLGVVY